VCFYLPVRNWKNNETTSVTATVAEKARPLRLNNSDLQEYIAGKNQMHLKSKIVDCCTFPKGPRASERGTREEKGRRLQTRQAHQEAALSTFTSRSLLR